MASNPISESSEYRAVCVVFHRAWSYPTGYRHQGQCSLRPMLQALHNCYNLTLLAKIIGAHFVLILAPIIQVPLAQAIEDLVSLFD